MKLAIGFVALFLVLHGLATVLESNRGEWGLVIAALVFLTTYLVQRTLHGEGLAAIGVQPEFRGLSFVVMPAIALIVVAAVYFQMVGQPVAFVSSWPWLALGMLAQGGLAEELIFRGYLFSHMRRRRSFWPAAFLSMVPFAAVHLILFLTMEWTLALAALALSVLLSFPYARLYELGRWTIWAPALLHAVTQAGPKLLVTDDSAFPLFWMVTAIVVSWSVFLVRRTSSRLEN